MDLKLWQRTSIGFCIKLGKLATETLEMLQWATLMISATSLMVIRKSCHKMHVVFWTFSRVMLMACVEAQQNFSENRSKSSSFKSCNQPKLKFGSTSFLTMTKQQPWVSKSPELIAFIITSFHQFLVCQDYFPAFCHDYLLGQIFSLFAVV